MWKIKLGRLVSIAVELQLVDFNLAVVGLVSDVNDVIQDTSQSTVCLLYIGMASSMVYTMGHVKLVITASHRNNY